MERADYVKHVVSDLISLMNHGGAVGWTCSWAPSGAQKPCLQPLASIMQKKENEYSQVGVGGNVALEQPSHV